jgi:voltage-gated potassium channel
METVQTFRILLICSGLVAGGWLPLKLLHFPISGGWNQAFGLLVTLSSFLSLYLRFRERGSPLKRLRDWVSPGLASDLICLIAAWSQGGLILGSGLMIRHVFRIKRFLDDFHSLDPVSYRLVRIGLTMPLLVHLVACAWIALGSGSAGPDPDRSFEYIKAIYWAVTTLATVGYGDITAKTPGQMLLSCGVQVLGIGVFGFVLSNVTSLLSRMDAAREHHMDNMERAETFMRSNHIPEKLRSSVRAYYRYLWKSQRGYEDHSILDNLPAKLQSDLYFFINRPMIEKVPLFKHAGDEMIRELMHELKPRIFAPGERIFKAGDPGTALYFINNGKIAILGTDNDLIARLEEGSCFGEMALISDKPRSAAARAETFCRVYELSRDSFERVALAYPQFLAQIENIAESRGSIKAA